MPFICLLQANKYHSLPCRHIVSLAKIKTMYWQKRTPDERMARIQQALTENVNFSTDASLGYPASRLDSRVFYEEAPFLRDAPVLQTYVANPNHIGCHTMGTSEKAFGGTQALEREVLDIVGVDIFKAIPDSLDGYISPGGTEANIQALWMYRNYFMHEHHALPHQIAIMASEDTHYSIAKGANLLQLEWICTPVERDHRTLIPEQIAQLIADAMQRGIKYLIVVGNMGTTMFGSVDDVAVYTSLLDHYKMHYKMHIDGAYGGFVHPFSQADHSLTFLNPAISSVTIDAHKMLQAPYGTGIFLCRKNLIHHVMTQEAAYVEGMDVTLCGSRSGANAVAVWMILATYGPHGWYEKISILQMRTQFLCRELALVGVRFFRNPSMNIVTIDASFISTELAEKYTLVPQTHTPDNRWYKIVVMDHVEIEHLHTFIQDLKAALYAEKGLSAAIYSST